MKKALLAGVVLLASSVTYLFYPKGEEAIVESAQMEMRVATTLAESATNQAIASGLWSNTDTWENGIPANDSRVVIPTGMTVTVDTTTNNLFWVRIDGVLRFSTNLNTSLILDTLFISPDGKLEMGTDQAPIQSNVVANLIIKARNNQPIDQSWDSFELSRGISSEGLVEMEGPAKTHQVRVTTLPVAGSNQVYLNDVPAGWVNGDEVVVTGTRYNTQEVFTIANIDGTNLTLNQPLKQVRAFPAGCVDCFINVANLTRNVVVQTDPLNINDKRLRGHVMIMHRGGQRIRYARFKNLGRTTTQPVSDPVIINGVRQASLMPLAGLTAENIRGRYSLHFHLAGITSAQSSVIGSVVDNTKDSGFKLGFTNHESNVSFRNNIGFQIDGSHFFTEEGTETGEFIDNIAIHSRGDQNGGLDHQLSVQSALQNYPNEWNRARLDVGFKGTGFWIHGGVTPASGNIAVGMSDTGINVWPRPLDFGKNNTYHLRVPVEVLGNPTWTGNAADIEIENVPWTVIDNWVYAIGGGDRYDTATCYENKYTLLHQWQDFPQSPKSNFSQNRGWNCHKGIQTAYAGFVQYSNVWLLQGASHNPRGTGFGMNLLSQGGNRNDLTNVSVNGYSTDNDVCIRPSSATSYTNVTCDGIPYSN